MGCQGLCVRFLWVRAKAWKGKLNVTIQPALAYMENSLRLNEETSPEMVQKNEIRLAIIKYFKQRDCFTLVRPVHEETKLRVVD